MDSMHRNTLPKEKIMDSACNVSNISEYLNRVSVCIKNRQQGDGIVVYRGEPEVYDQPCRPNIFRKDYLIKCFFKIGTDTYWMGTTSNISAKKGQMERLCALAEVNRNEIYWYENSAELVFQW